MADLFVALHFNCCTQEYEVSWEKWNHSGGLYPRKSELLCRIPTSGLYSHARSPFLREWVQRFRDKGMKFSTEITLPGDSAPYGGPRRIHYKRQFDEAEPDLLMLAGFALKMMEEQQQCRLASLDAESVTPTPH